MPTARCRRSSVFCAPPPGAVLGVLLMGLFVAHAATAQPRTWRVDPGHSRLVVHVARAGVLSAALHDHQFVAQRWSGTVSFDPEHPERSTTQLSVAAGSLHDVEPGISANDVRSIENDARGAEVLDVARYPEVTLASQRLEITPGTLSAGALHGTLVASLTLHGQTRPMRIPVEATWTGNELRVRGSVGFRQSGFGITPYHRALGAIAVRDMVNVEFDVRATP